MKGRKRFINFLLSKYSHEDELKRIATLSLIALLALTNFMFSQSLTRADFISVITPQYMASGTANRLPVVFYAKLQNLNPGQRYRYYIQGALISDIGTKNTGAGNPLFMNPDSATFVYSSNPSLTKAGNYSVFRTDASGSYTGWFCFVNTGNSRFTPGNYVTPTIALADSNGTSLALRALSDSIAVLGFYSAATDTAGTGVWSKSSGKAKDIVLLYDSTNGTGRPLSIAYIESDGTTIASIVKFYSDSVNAIAGNWGTIIPNVNAKGVRKIEQRSLSTGEIVSTHTSTDGVWGKGVSTVNPAGGTTAIEIDTTNTATGIAAQKKTAAPQSFMLSQNYPNPFNPSTMIQFSVPQSGMAKLVVTNILGQQVRVLFDGPAIAGQLYSVSFHAQGLSSGIYYYSLTSGTYSLTKKLIFMQ